eukprot:TRINITY_DN35473_c0_g1_i1.p1 TRINITY_DN35473_c0_g1~~TRINITY_DN35473_c0_g1_i1.p1  ORF type:complete len:130 (-),score=5.96 TRINITY_DN35473_c0_g1_i1:17-406(-)
MKLSEDGSVGANAICRGSFQAWCCFAQENSNVAHCPRVERLCGQRTPHHWLPNRPFKQEQNSGSVSTGSEPRRSAHAAFVFGRTARQMSSSSPTLPTQHFHSAGAQQQSGFHSTALWVRCKDSKTLLIN